MNKKDSQLLDECLLHYDRLLKCESREGFSDEGYGGSSCPFCREYRNNECENCPINKKTGHTSCEHTPFSNMFYEVRRFVNGRTDTIPRLRIKEMRDFLVSLRGEE